MATPYQIVGGAYRPRHAIGGAYRPRHAIAHKYGSALYVRLWHRNNDELSVWKSTDDGATWTQAGGVISVGWGTTFIPGCGTAFGNILYVSYFKFPNTVAIARYDMAADDWTTDITGPTADFSQWNQVGVRSDGSLVLVYMHTETDPFGGPGAFRRKWKYWTAAGGAADISTAWQTWFDVSQDPYLGPVIIDTNDTAHFFYYRSESGSLNTDTQLMYRSLTSGGTLSSETLAVDFDGTVFGARGGVAVAIGGTESTVYALTDGDGITNAPAILHGAATGVPATYSVHPSIATTQQGVANIGDSAWGTWPVSESSGEFTGVQIGAFTGGAWGATETVNDGAGGEPTWTWWMVSALGTDALGFVLDHYTDENPWFMRYAVTAGPGPAARYYAM